MISDELTAEVCSYFQSVQTRLIDAFRLIDPDAALSEKSWQKEGGEGGGHMRVLRGEAVEKAGANFSQVRGASYPSLEKDFSGQPYFASGVSTICHMMNPHAPIAHANLRLLKVGQRFWFGGGADLTPCFPYSDDTRDFHAALQSACGVLGEDAYGRYHKWCDEYFYIPHRKSIRGVGGIFFDYLEKDYPLDVLIEFVRRVGDAYVSVYPQILKRRVNMPYSPEEKEQQLYWRGRYAEFNLAYDRGTKFGLMSGGNVEAIFVSLPPVVKW